MTDSFSSPNLLDEYPLLVYPSLAKAMGINKAAVFQQLHFLLKAQQTSKNEYVFINGRWWVYNSYDEWHIGHFLWLAPVTLKGIFRDLEADGLVLTMQGVKNKSDRRKWYTIDYQAWEAYRKSLVLKISDPSDKKYLMVGYKVSNGYSETPSETPSKKKKVPKKTTAKTRLQILLEELEPINDLVDEMLAVCESGYTKGFQKPSEYMTIPHLEKYLPMAQELKRFNCQPSEIKKLYDFIDEQSPDRQWNIAPQTLVRKYHEFVAWKAAQESPVTPVPKISPNGGKPLGTGKQIDLSGRNPFKEKPRA